VHPNEIPGENPGERKHIDRAKDETAEVNPRKAGKCLKNAVMELYSNRCSPRKKPPYKTEYVNYLRAQYALPAI